MHQSPVAKRFVKHDEPTAATARAYDKREKTPIPFPTRVPHLKISFPRIVLLLTIGQGGKIVVRDRKIKPLESGAASLFWPIFGPFRLRVGVTTVKVWVGSAPVPTITRKPAKQ